MRDLVLERELGDYLVAYRYDHTRPEMRCQCCGAARIATAVGGGFVHHAVYADLHRDPRGRVTHRYGCVVVTCGSVYCASKVQAIGEQRARIEVG